MGCGSGMFGDDGAQSGGIEDDHAATFEAHQSFLGQLPQRASGDLAHRAGSFGELLLGCFGTPTIGILEQLPRQALAHRAKRQIFDEHDQPAHLAGHVVEECQAEFRMLTNEHTQGIRREYDALDDAHGARRRRVGLPIEGRDEIEAGAGAQHRQHLFTAIDGGAGQPYTAVLDEEDLAGLFALVDDLLTGPVVDAVHASGDDAKCGIVERVEQAKYAKVCRGEHAGAPLSNDAPGAPSARLRARRQSLRCCAEAYWQLAPGPERQATMLHRDRTRIA
jgi:hypothetical protein